MVQLEGGCHCGNLHLTMGLTRPPSGYAPRECDCDFCQRHGAAYVSDPAGTLRLQIEDEGRVTRYRQGAERAVCLLCSSCGVLVAVLYEEGARSWATVNFRAVDRAEFFGARTAVSPKLLEADEKLERWKRIWIPDPTIA
jgi:hypothetical protein